MCFEHIYFFFYCRTLLRLNYERKVYTAHNINIMCSSKPRARKKKSTKNTPFGVIVLYIDTTRNQYSFFQPLLRFTVIGRKIND